MRREIHSVFLPTIQNYHEGRNRPSSAIFSAPQQLFLHFSAIPHLRMNQAVLGIVSPFLSEGLRSPPPFPFQEEEAMTFFGIHSFFVFPLFHCFQAVYAARRLILLHIEPRLLQSFQQHSLCFCPCLHCQKCQVQHFQPSISSFIKQRQCVFIFFPLL